MLTQEELREVFFTLAEAHVALIDSGDVPSPIIERVERAMSTVAGGRTRQRKAWEAKVRAYIMTPDGAGI